MINFDRNMIKIYYTFGEKNIYIYDNS